MQLVLLYDSIYIHPFLIINIEESKTFVIIKISLNTK